MHVLWTIDLDCCRHFSVRVGNIVFLNQIKMIKATVSQAMFKTEIPFVRVYSMSPNEFTVGLLCAIYVKLWGPETCLIVPTTHDGCCPLNVQGLVSKTLILSL